MGDGIGYMRTFCKRSFGTEDVMERTKILVVDDESRMRKLVKDFLQKIIMRFWKRETGVKRWIFSLPRTILPWSYWMS